MEQSLYTTQNTQDLSEFYDNAFDMMSTQGWKDLMEDIGKVKNTYDRLSSVTETHSLDFRRGQIDILSWLLGLKGAYEQTYKDLQETGEV